MQGITIGDRAVGPGEPTYVIAEAGSNHNGDLGTAKALIDVAVEAGADAVKSHILLPTLCNYISKRKHKYDTAILTTVLT